MIIKMKKIFFLLVAIYAIAFSCSKEKTKEIDTPNKGEIILEADESLKALQKL
jgi:phosphate transport system substrate-binding protein